MHSALFNCLPLGRPCVWQVAVLRGQSTTHYTFFQDSNIAIHNDVPVTSCQDCFLYSKSIHVQASSSLRTTASTFPGGPNHLISTQLIPHVYY